MCIVRLLVVVFSARDQNQVLKEVEMEGSLDDLYYDAFSGEFHVIVTHTVSYIMLLCRVFLKFRNEILSDIVCAKTES